MPAHQPHHLLLPLPPSKGFIEQQVKMFKTVLNTSQDVVTSLEDLLLDLLSTPISQKMYSPREILHMRTTQCPGKASTPLTWKLYTTTLYPRSNSRSSCLTNHTVQSRCLSSTLARKYFSCPKWTTAHMSPAPSWTRNWPHKVTPLRPKAKSTAELDSTSALSNKTSSPGTPHYIQSPSKPLSWAASLSSFPNTRAQPQPVYRHTIQPPVHNQLHSQATVREHLLAKPHTITQYPYSNSELPPQSSHCLKLPQATQTHWCQWSIAWIPEHQLHW